MNGKLSPVLGRTLALAMLLAVLGAGYLPPILSRSVEHVEHTMNN